jgi:PAS domain-containing protein
MMPLNWPNLDAAGTLSRFTRALLDRRRPTPRTAQSETETRLAGIIDSAMDAIISVDEDQRIVIFNTAAVSVVSVLGQGSTFAVRLR